MDSKKQKIFFKIVNYIWNMVYALIIIPIVIISMIIIYKTIRYPNKIPDILGYKVFIILDEKMDESIEYGDLVFTKIIDTDILKNNDLIAFRNNDNIVTIHRIIDKTENNNKKVFTMKTLENETPETKMVNEDRVEGIVIDRIANLGIILLLLQEPLVLATIILTILIFGLIAYYIADRLDKKEINKSQNNTNNKKQDKK